MLTDPQTLSGGDAAAETAASAVEFEIALDMQDLSDVSFEDCVRGAAGLVGGEMLFAVPTGGSIEDASQIAAVRIASNGRERILFALLDEAEGAIRVPDREEVGERFYGFARAFIGVLTRIRDDMPFAEGPTEGRA